MRIVVDTNVIVSAAFKESSWPAGVLRWVGSFGGLLKSTDTEREVFEVLQRPRIARNTLPLFGVQLRQIFDDAVTVTINARIAACRDPKDDKFLELAMNGHADVIVSGDIDLLVLERFRGIPIITPAAFCHAQSSGGG
jgi:putative PIN family toxin of toxin-antitoxin system